MSKKSIGLIAHAIKSRCEELGETDESAAANAGMSKALFRAYKLDAFEANTPGVQRRLAKHPNPLSVAKIAIALNGPIPDWVAGSGFDYSNRLEEQARSALRKSKHGFKGRHVPEGSPIHGRVLATLRNRQRHDGKVPVRASIIKTIVRTESNTFNVAFAKLLCRVINHDWRLIEDFCDTEMRNLIIFGGKGAKPIWSSAL